MLANRYYNMHIIIRASRRGADRGGLSVIICVCTSPWEIFKPNFGETFISTWIYMYIMFHGRGVVKKMCPYGEKYNRVRCTNAYYL